MTLAYNTFAAPRHSRLAILSLCIAASNPLFFLAAYGFVDHVYTEAAMFLLATALLLPSAVAAYLALFAFLHIRLNPHLRGIACAVIAGILSVTWPNLVAAYFYLPR
jgi:hypothetical protein